MIFEECIAKSGNEVIISLNDKIYGDRSVFEASAPFITDFFISIDKQNGRTIIRLKPKSGSCDLDELACAFLDSLLTGIGEING